MAVVISERFWKTWLGGTADVLGRKLQIDNTVFTVAGVMPKPFIGADPMQRPQIYVPLAAEAILQAPDSMTAAGYHGWWLSVMGRLQPGVTLDQANAALQSESMPILRESVPDADWIADATRTISISVRSQIARVSLSSPYVQQATHGGFRDVRRRFAAGVFEPGESASGAECVAGKGAGDAPGAGSFAPPAVATAADRKFADRLDGNSGRVGGGAGSEPIAGDDAVKRERSATRIPGYVAGLEGVRIRSVRRGDHGHAHRTATGYEGHIRQCERAKSEMGSVHSPAASGGVFCRASCWHRRWGWR